MSAPSPAHIPGLDPLGRHVPIAIRIESDGRVSFHDITPEFLPVALALDPSNQDLLTRVRIAQQFSISTPAPTDSTGSAP